MEADQTQKQTGFQLEPIQPVPLKERVISQLRRLIDEGGLGPGDQLPSERELSEQLQVSRGTVREALQFLQALGRLEIRHGSGTFVRASSRDDARLRSEWREWVRRHSDQVRELLEVRKGLESFVAELAAERIEAGSAGAMLGALQQMEAAAREQDVTALVEADVLFHDALVQAASNSVLRDLTTMLGQQLIPERAAIFDMHEDRPWRSVNEHRAIYEAVQAGDGPAARRAVFNHLSSVQQDLDLLLSEAGTAPEAPEPGQGR